MTTARNIQRLWDGKLHQRLFRELISTRPEASLRIADEVSVIEAAAALALIRLDELSQRHVPLYTTLVRSLVSSQKSDGSWGDLMTTALVLRGLMLCEGTGLAIDRGLAFLAGLQKADGLWPNIPLRRMPSDAAVSAFILAQLADSEKFRRTIRFHDVTAYFTQNERLLEPHVQRLWRNAVLRARLSPYLDHARSGPTLFQPTGAAA